VGEGFGLVFRDGVDPGYVFLFFPLSLEFEQELQVLVDDAAKALFAKRERVEDFGLHRMIRRNQRCARAERLVDSHGKSFRILVPVGNDDCVRAHQFANARVRNPARKLDAIPYAKILDVTHESPLCPVKARVYAYISVGGVSVGAA
jgi:hypothetical protein